ncbi:hypothetical protein OC498_13950 [Acinetobacter bohemicus]|uniref:hypothetical protein n=1 Tax=Acinetobacter TaxID=469 RepID=UPI00209AF6DA|nr:MULTISPECIES: hypothetical protein [Acinetobacter]MCO8043711.1 hypothetical protein [Acinetobacter sp. S4400-12]MCU7225973.1 hypothetical protein [Acinetobacter bohemicus]
MKHLGFVGKLTEYIGYTHVEIINSSLRLSFKVSSRNNLEEMFKKMVENNYDALMATSAEIDFELDADVLEKAEQVIKAHGVEVEEYIQNILIKLINADKSVTTDQL